MDNNSGVATDLHNQSVIKQMDGGTPSALAAFLDSIMRTGSSKDGKVLSVLDGRGLVKDIRILDPMLINRENLELMISDIIESTTKAHDELTIYLKSDEVMQRLEQILEKNEKIVGKV